MPIHVDNPAKALATAILMQAIKEHHNPKKRDEVNNFFRSDWFEDVCDLAMVNPDVVRKKLHIIILPNTARTRTIDNEMREIEQAAVADFLEFDDKD
jgi:hypothetical protein